MVLRFSKSFKRLTLSISRITIKARLTKEAFSLSKGVTVESLRLRESILSFRVTVVQVKVLTLSKEVVPSIWEVALTTKE